MRVVTATKRASSGQIQVWYGQGTSGGPDDGIFEATGNVELPIQAVASVRVCQGTPGNEFNGDALFEIMAVDWNPNGDFTLRIGTWHRDSFFEKGERRAYTRDLDFAITINYVT